MVRAMVRLFVGQLPAWARRDHPVLHHELGAEGRLSRRARLLRAFGGLLAVAVLLGIGVLIATDMLRAPAGQTNVESVNAVLYYPLLLLQVGLSIAALLSTTNFVGDEIRRQNWDNLRATEQGAEMAMRARWVAVFYRLRAPLAVVFLGRVVLIGVMLWELTAFQGRYLDLLINGIVPDVPLVAAVLLVSFLMTSALLLPLTSVGFDAAVGLLISSFVPQRTYSALIQIVLIFVRIAITVAFVAGALSFLRGEMFFATDLGAWLLMAGYGALGDWGLGLLNLGRSSEIWATVPYGILINLVLLVFALVQAAVADRLLMLAVRLAQKKG